MSSYDHSNVEKKWQRIWKDKNLFKAEKKEGSPKRYILSMFPYPSGKLHMGHVMNYTIGDVMVRYSLLKGFNVLSPIGWDSFGLPAENAAIKQGIHPSENIRVNIENMRLQMRSAGWGFDWSREIATSHEDYYRWTQWLFLKFYEKGLAKKKTAPVNWCPNDKTVLANEQVHDGRCERCGTEVEQKDLEQWFFLMSEYAEKLLENHNKLKNWPERVLKMQQEWIGRSEGAEVNFEIEGSDEKISVFTTRPDTLFGVTFMSIAPQHPLIEKLVSDNPDRDKIMDRINTMRRESVSEAEMAEPEKEGVFTGKYAVNPVNGDRVPLWVANFVLMSYGTGIVMAVPAHDQRDFEFACKYNIPVKVVINRNKDEIPDPALMKETYVEDGFMVDSGQFTGRNNREAMADIISWLDDEKIGGPKVNYKLRDWLISRQRYWGVPIPVVYCDKCGIVPVPEKDLPVKLPKGVEFRPEGESPLKGCESFMNTKCPECGGDARRDPDTMDTFVDSSWYYLRYLSPRNDKSPFDKNDLKYWAPADIYIGGIEHATMHLIYFRFFAFVLHELGLIDFEEPVDKLFTQGMVCREAYYCDKHKWLSEEEVENGCCVKCNLPVRSEVTKMSKTKLNVVSPEKIIKSYGADAMRLYILSDTPADRDQIWSDEGVRGVSRFVNRLWNTHEEIIHWLESGDCVDTEGEMDREVRRKTHSVLADYIETFDGSWQFNTVIARITEMLSLMKKSYRSLSREVLMESSEILIKLLSPMVPHICEELWERMGNKCSIFLSGFPEIDRGAMKQDEKVIIVQINGKLRDKFSASAEAGKEELETRAFGLEKIKTYIEGKNIFKVVVVPGKLVNIVAK